MGVIVQKLLLQQGSKAMDAGHVLELLTGHPVDVRRKQELAAMKRIFGGINWVDEEDWVSANIYIYIIYSSSRYHSLAPFNTSLSRIRSLTSNITRLPGFVTVNQILRIAYTNGTR